jgi:uncharacterized protein YlaN (UPF0358 family)
MWADFTDFELVVLAGKYGVSDEVVFSDDLRLVNRKEIENLLTLVEFEFAYGE